MDPVLMKVADKCFEEFENTSIYFCVSQLLSVIHLENDPNSLKMLALKAAFEEALEIKEILKGVESVLKEESILPCNHHFIENYPHLILLTVNSFIKNNPTSSFSLLIGNTKCQIGMNGKPIYEFDNVEIVKWVGDYTKLMIQNNVKSFTVTVTETNDPNENHEEKLGRILLAIGIKTERIEEIRYWRLMFHLKTLSAAVMKKY